MNEILERLKWHREHVFTGPGRELGNNFVKVYDHAETLEKLLLSLTPGGSEFHGSPEKCAEWIHERQATMGRLAAERNSFRSKAERLAEALEIVERLSRKGGTEDDWDTYIAPIMCEQGGSDEGGAYFDAIADIAHAALAAWQEGK